MLFELPQDEKSIIKVIGVGGGGSNAVNHMFSQGIVGVDFAICNTDNQALDISEVPVKIHLGPALTEGRGAGSKPQVGKEACIESIDDVRRFLERNTKMLFVTAGMGGGTGTGAAPIIAKVAREMDILTVGIVTVPFTFEGRRRSSQAKEGLEELKKNVDAVIIVSNDKLREIHGNLPISAAFAQADNILTTAAKGIAEIITMPGYVNVDFEDVSTVMKNSGVAIMGTAMMDGPDRAKKAVNAALNSPLLEENDIRGAQHILLNITSGTTEVTMDEIFEITEYVQEEAGFGVDLIWGNCYDEQLGEKLSVTLIATGFEALENKKKEVVKEKIVVSLEEDDRTIGHEEGIFELDKSESTNPVIEFEDIPVRKTIQYSYEDPYIKSEEQKMKEKEENRRKQVEKARRENLREVGRKKLNPQNIINMENEPAYARRKVQFDEVPHSSEQSEPRYVVNIDGEPEIKEDNTFLHDNVD
ncbi:MAG: cell division protein FtsZ [Bacteroidota bacterium]